MTYLLLDVAEVTERETVSIGECQRKDWDTLTVQRCE